MTKERDTTIQLEFRGISKSYDGVVVLDDINLSIDQGEFVFLVGDSGVGKSTLVKILIREEDPDVGEIYLNGENILEVPKKKIFTVRRNIGVVFQDFKLLESKTVFENVAIALEVTDASRTEINAIVPNVLSLVGLSDKKNHMSYQLSGGEKQRVAIARALAHEPDILVADEPTGMIDPKAGERVMEVLEHINHQGATVLMATHNQTLVDKMKKRVVRLLKGKIVSDKKGGLYDE